MEDKANIPQDEELENKKKPSDQVHEQEEDSHSELDCNLAHDEGRDEYISKPMRKKRLKQPNPNSIRSPSRWEDYFVKGDKLYKDVRDSNGTVTKTVPISNWMLLSEIQQNIDSSRFKLKIEFIYAGKVRNIEISKGSLTKLKIMELLDHGLDVTEDNIRDVLRVLRLQEECAPIRNIHDGLGWGEYDDKVIFKLNESLGIESTYCGKLSMEPKGTLESWKALMESEVMGHTPLELALIIGLSAPVVAMLKDKTGVNVLLFHLYGNSTEGKSTATLVAVSPFGLPKIGDDGLVKTFSATDNAIIAYLRGNMGVPIGIDEASTQSHKDFTEFIYTITSGLEKARLSKTSEMQVVHSYSTSIITNAENSLIRKSNQNIGLQMRAFEIGNIAWTKDAANSDRLKKELSENYGHAGIAFAEYLMQLNIDDVFRRWQEWSQKCMDTIENKNHFSQRIANKLAILMLAAELASEALNLQFHIHEILKLLLRVENRTDSSTDIGENALDKLMEHYNRYDKFFTKQYGNEILAYSGPQFLGLFIYRKGEYSELLIQPSTLEEILKQYGFQDKNVVLSNWRLKGILDCDKDKFTRKRKIASEKESRVHVIRIKNQNDEDKNN